MVVNSLSFLLFFSVVFAVYYFVFPDKYKWKNVWLLIASYFFYGCAEWKMIPLLLVATLLFYRLGLAIGYYNDKCEKKASLLTVIGVLLGVGILLYFKYLNFFIESFGSFFNAIGLRTDWHTFSIIMPLGISFFTFKLISYVIEVHRRRIPSCESFISFATYISFFPTILSGPIDRPKAFLSQLESNRNFSYSMAVDGLRQILWGMFKKMVIADNLALITGNVWHSYHEFSGPILLLNVLFYPFQMYMDFSGYSDMAIGVGKLLGLKVAKNFNYPFLGRNIAEYWKNWHMSLTSWLTDYVFMPLNIYFRNWNKFGSVLAIIITFILIGLWHGANLTFALFGLYHGLLYIPLMYNGSFFKKTKLVESKYGTPLFRDFCKMLSTYLLVSLGLILFASVNITEAGEYCIRMFSTLIEVPTYSEIMSFVVSKNIFLCLLFFSLTILVLEWKSRKLEYGLCLVETYRNKYVRYLIYEILVISILFLRGHTVPFMYFQF
ncbi:MBOAT family O-acyltransferase [Bacteroides sp. GD17]|jgi:alginate O-acetyltransferase complex protein AlgI|uniref:MBOAT family O-acyltransferase n=1 Tax=Bacteroides sp. GD17 TaxID=3139826 RepID=UPI0025DCB611|nr:MBOAT family O-acyltransferase [uncultured Bacteroides sp.]